MKGELTESLILALTGLTDGRWHSVPSLVQQRGQPKRSGGAIGVVYSRLHLGGLAEVRYDGSGYWAVAEYRITDAGREALRSQAEP